MPHALRLLAKNPGFAAVAILTLALGIGANTAIFTIANALLLRPLAFIEPDRLVQIGGVPRDDRKAGKTLSYPFYKFLAERQKSFTVVSACTFENFSLTGRGDAEQIVSARVSWNFFDLLGIQPI